MTNRRKFFVIRIACTELEKHDSTKVRRQLALWLALGYLGFRLLGSVDLVLGFVEALLVRAKIVTCARLCLKDQTKHAFSMRPDAKLARAASTFVTSFPSSADPPPTKTTLP